jgi:protein-disulfide isomerase
MSRQGRIRTQELRRAQEAAAHQQARRRRVFTALGGLVILGLITAIIVAVLNASGGENAPEAATGKIVVPGNLTPNGAIPVGKADAPVTVEIYYDYMCPACGRFEAANAGELDRLLDDGVVRIELRPISFLDRQSRGTEYSTRTANAIATVGDAAPDRAWDFHSALFEHQPAEGTKGFTDDQIAAIATAAGVPEDVVGRFAGGTYGPWVAKVTQEAFDSGIEQTPTVKINGAVFDGDVFTTGVLTEAIESAAADQ